MSFQRIWRLKDILLDLVGIRCKDCGYTCYPPKAACPKCSSRNIERIALGSVGKIVSYTVVNVPIEGFENMSPLVIALVETSNGKVLTQLTNVKPEEVRLGMEVEATIRRSAMTLDGYVPYIVKFKPKES
ncbi:MAG: Zn-ribbon domain-containing OB-fold protein [Sulfolobales archaeon]|nr:Zn-ribbon domain-containing OB-fold protein [Sulfolobales archaeon]MCX8186470.1 Zn-ribbon domain-containing OB-fold protein [Sulfolobales archaeon]MDW7969800.1 Zn-ribbon domain-containing OB-fold protein [Sulfolobales archaeon]